LKEPYNQYSLLLDRTARKVKWYAQQQFKELGFDMTVDQWLVMKLTDENEALSQRELAALMYKDMPEYEPTVGATVKFLENYWGNENSDPQKVAEIVLKVSEANEVPTHILVGSDAYNLVKEASAKRWEEAEKWKDLSVYADFGNEMLLPDLMKK
jgi:hypothetical protein